MTVGENIKRARKESGLSQEALASMLGLKHKASVCKVEKSGDLLTVTTARRYAEALRVPINQLFE